MLAPAWQAMREVDRYTANPDIRRGVAKVRDALREIENDALDVARRASQPPVTGHECECGCGGFVPDYAEDPFDYCLEGQ